jgi:hypothetical protein
MDGMLRAEGGPADKAVASETTGAREGRDILPRAGQARAEEKKPVPGATDEH